MIKNLRFFLLSMIAMLAGTVMADEVTDVLTYELFASTNQNYVDFANVKVTSNAVYAGQSAASNNTIQLRTNNSNSGVVTTASGGKLLSVKVKFNENTTNGRMLQIYGKTTAYTAATDLYSDATSGTLIAEVAITNGAEQTITVEGEYSFMGFRSKSGALFLDEVQVKWDGEATVNPNPEPEPNPVDVETEGEGTLEKPYTVADAIKVAGALTQGAQTATDVYVSGVISTIKYTFDAEHGTATFFISADGEAADEFQCYSVYYLENKSWVEGNTQIEQGDEVIIYGRLTNYNGTLETASKKAYIYSLNGVTKNEVEEEPVAEPTIDGGTTAETAITVEAAVAAINSMNNSQTTTAEYYVKGIVTQISEIGTSFGNATFTIRTSAEAQDSLLVYRALGLQKGSISDAEYLNVGDEVIVVGKLQKYVKNDAVIPELAQGGYIYSINGNTQPEEKPLELVGDGSKTNPYTVSDLKQLDPNSITIEGNVYVKGIIVGAMNNNNVEGENTEVNTNLVIAATAEASVKDEVVPVELKSKTVFRDNLNIPDHKDLIGKEIVFYGELVKYFSIVGVKNLKAYILNGEEITSGIAEVKTADRFQNAIYNLRGQRVKTPAKGLFIMNGKKYFVK